MLSIYDYSQDELKTKLAAIDERPYRATQIFTWLYKKQVLDFAEMTDIKKTSQAKLKNEFAIDSLETVNKLKSVDGTVKYLFRLKDGNYIETVLMRKEYGLSVCVSSQVGCNMGCSFCASGIEKKVRNLSVSEMVLQIQTINLELKKTNERASHVVVMGIGEPFDNYANLLEFIKIINDYNGLEIGARHITVSTCGIAPMIKKYAEFPLQVNLAVSLHFPNDVLRSKYMKINKAYPIPVLMDAVRFYYAKTKRRVTIEYILLAGINDTEECALELVRLLRGLTCYVNLIPFNKTKKEFQRSTIVARKRFIDILMQNKIDVTLRIEQGGDISAACGQLRIKKIKEDTCKA